MKKITAALLSAILILTSGIGCNAQEIAEVSMAESTDAVTYLSVAEDTVSKGQTESIVVGFSLLSDQLTNAVLTVENVDSGIQYQVSETERTENGILFAQDFYTNGTYEIAGVSYRNGETEETIDFSDIGIDAVFGVNEEVSMNADAIVLDGSESDTSDFEAVDEEANAIDNLAAEELEAAVVTIDADNYESQAALLAGSLAASTAAAANTTLTAANTNGNIVVVLDPGHGGNDGGASATHNGVTYVESVLNLKIAQYCKAELEQYKGVTVYMTRSSDVYVGLPDRVEYAASVGADVFVSIHNNSATNSTANGAYVYYPNSNYDAAIGAEGEKLANQIANELAALGIVNHGAVIRSTKVDTYPDGSKEDFYAVIRRSKLAGFPGLIVEHAFISNASDAKNYLGSDAALKKLGVADATGIAKYFGLSKTTTVPSASRTTVPYVTYRSHVQNIGWQGYVQDGAVSGTTGQSLQMEAMNIRINPKSSVSGGITYKAHVSDIGWQDWVSDGEMTGTAGMSKSIEAVRMQLTGNLAAAYDLYYRAHSAEYGWLGWAKNGESAGTEGYGLRMEAIQIVLVKKGEAAPGSTINHFYSSNIEVVYNAHVQNIGWQGYRVNGDTAGTTGKALRVEALTVSLPDGVEGNISYKAHVQDIGWQDWRKDGEIAGTTGEALRVEAIQIKLGGAIASKYDVYYRVHSQDVGWSSWVKNGAAAGTTGRSLRIEAVQIKLVKK